MKTMGYKEVTCLKKHSNGRVWIHFCRIHGFQNYVISINHTLQLVSLKNWLHNLLFKFGHQQVETWSQDWHQLESQGVSLCLEGARVGGWSGWSVSFMQSLNVRLWCYLRILLYMYTQRDTNWFRRKNKRSQSPNLFLLAYCIRCTTCSALWVDFFQNALCNYLFFFF